MTSDIALPANRSRQIAAIAHLAGVANFVFPIAGLIGAIVLFITNADDPLVRANARQALNMQITYAIVAALCFAVYLGFFISMFVRMVGSPYVHHASRGPDLMMFGAAFGSMGLWFLATIVSAIFSVVGGVRASKGGIYRYPIAFRFMREPNA